LSPPQRATWMKMKSPKPFLSRSDLLVLAFATFSCFVSSTSCNLVLFFSCSDIIQLVFLCLTLALLSDATRWNGRRDGGKDWNVLCHFHTPVTQQHRRTTRMCRRQHPSMIEHEQPKKAKNINQQIKHVRGVDSSFIRWQ
jgi:hypothetical protein